MRAIPSSLADKLASGVTTLCRCWIVTRDDGRVLGFTDHDADLTIEGVLCEAASGLDAGAIETSTGLSVDSQSVTGALRSGAISEADIERGLYDGAAVAQWLVDWQAPEDRLVLSRGRIGEIRRSGNSFEAEIVGLAESLNKAIGRAYVRSCHLRLGEPRCGIDLSDPRYRASGLVIDARAPDMVRVAGIETFESGWFDGGTIRWTSGENAGTVSTVRRHRVSGLVAEIELWLAAPGQMISGDGLVIEAGCDKTFAVCREKFDNALNFRGFPHLPGDDWAAGYPQEGGAHDGGSLFRS